MHKSSSVATLASPFHASAFFDAQSYTPATNERLFRSATLSDQPAGLGGLDEGKPQQQQGKRAEARHFQWDAQASSSSAAHAHTQAQGQMSVCGSRMGDMGAQRGASLTPAGLNQRLSNQINQINRLVKLPVQSDRLTDC